MASVTLQLDEAAVREATVQALAGKLTPEGMKAIVEQAIRELLTPRNTYGSRTTPIEDAFQSAVREHVQRYAREIVAADAALQERLRALMADTLARMLDDSDEAARTAFVKRMADAFVSTLRRD